MLCCTSFVELLQYLAHRCVHVNLIKQTPRRQQRLFWEIIPASATVKQASAFHNFLNTGRCVYMHTSTPPFICTKKKVRINFFLYIAHYFHKGWLKADLHFYAEKTHTKTCLIVHLDNQFYFKKMKNFRGKGKLAWSEINIWKKWDFSLEILE